MRVGAAIFLSVFILLMGAQAVSFYRATRTFTRELAAISEELARAEEEYARLKAEYEYYRNPANLEKELRARFNYRLPDEKMVVIVPHPSSTGSSTNP